MIIALLLAHLVHLRFGSDSDEEPRIVETEPTPEPQPDYMSTSHAALFDNDVGIGGPSEEFSARPSSVHTNPSPPTKKSGRRLKSVAIPRQSRGSTSQTMTSHFRFVDDDAQRYYNQVSTRMIVTERGYPILNFSSKLVRSLGLGWVQELVRSLNLEKLVAGFPSSFRFNLSVVREFYANFPVLEEFEFGAQVVVRDTLVRLSPAVIYEYFSLPSPSSNDAYETFLDESSRYFMHDFSSLAFQDPELVLAHGTKPSRHHLSPSFRYVLHFIKTNLVPTGNAANVTLEAARLAILLYHRFPVPIGHIIYDAIVSKTRNVGKMEGSRGSLVFPCLIHHLCESSGVEMTGPEDIFQAPTSPVTEDFVKKSEKAVEAARKSKLSTGSVTEDSLAATVDAAVQKATSKLLQAFGVKKKKKSKSSSKKATDHE